MYEMILLNFLHPHTEKHLAQIEALSGKKMDRVIEVDSQVDPGLPLVPQVVAIADGCGLSPVEWQTLPLLLNPQSLHWVAVTFLAKIHGRSGYFPPHLRLRPVEGTMSRRFEVVGVLDLQGVRDRFTKKGIDRRSYGLERMTRMKNDLHRRS